MAFDYGERSIGVSVGQSLTGTATELRPLKAHDGVPDWLDIGKLLADWQPNLVIVGHPLNMDGSNSEFGIRANKFARRIHGRFGIQVELFDERLSTMEAKKEAQSRGHKGNYRHSPIDSIAARIILESWFNSNQRG